MSDDGLLVSDYDRFAMLPEAVLFAPISAQAVRLFAVLLRYAGEKGAAWPSRTSLAKKLHVKSTDTVDRTVRELREYGLLDVQHRSDERGQQTNVYRLKRRPLEQSEGGRKSAAGGGRTDAEGGSRMDAEGPAARMRHEREPGNESQSERESESPTGSPARPREPRPVVAVPDQPSGFEEWWRVYPRRVGKTAARTAYRAAVRKGASEQQLLDGARRYADDPTRDPAFTAHPTTWLHQGRWEDEGPVRPQSAPPPSRAQGWLELAGQPEQPALSAGGWA